MWGRYIACMLHVCMLFRCFTLCRSPPATCSRKGKLNLLLHLYCFFATVLISKMCQWWSAQLLWIYVTLMLLYNARHILGYTPQFFSVSETHNFSDNGFTQPNTTTCQNLKQTYKASSNASYNFKEFTILTLQSTEKRCKNVGLKRPTHHSKSCQWRPYTTFLWQSQQHHCQQLQLQCNHLCCGSLWAHWRPVLVHLREPVSPLKASAGPAEGARESTEGQCWSTSLCVQVLLYAV